MRLRVSSETPRRLSSCDASLSIASRLDLRAGVAGSFFADFLRAFITVAPSSRILSVSLKRAIVCGCERIILQSVIRP